MFRFQCERWTHSMNVMKYKYFMVLLSSVQQRLQRPAKTKQRHQLWECSDDFELGTVQENWQKGIWKDKQGHRPKLRQKSNMIDWSPNLRKSCILLCIFTTHEIEAFVKSYMTASLGVCLSIATTWEEFFSRSGHIPCHWALIGRFWLTAMFLLDVSRL